MDAMTQSTPFPQTLTDAIEALVQERVVAALATEKECRLAMTVKLEGDAYQRGYAQALTDLEDAWAGQMQRLWSSWEPGPVAPAAGPGWPWEGGAVWSDGQLAAIRAAGPGPGAVVQFPMIGPGLAANMTEWDRMLVEQGAPHIGQMPDPEPPAAPPNVHGWPEAALAVLRRQWPRYVTEREVQNEVEGILLETTPIWKIRAQAKAMGLAQPPMPRLSKGAKLVEVTWHQAAMLARGYGIAFTGDMQALNQARIADSRLPCLLTQPDGPTAEDIAAYGPATL